MKRMLGAFFFCLFEHAPQFGFAFAVEFADHLRSANREKGGVVFGSDGAREQRFPTARRPSEQHAGGGLYPQSFKHAGVLKRELDRLANASQGSIEPADVFIREALVAGRRSGHRRVARRLRGLHGEPRLRMNQNGLRPDA